MLVYLKDLVPMEEQKGWSIPCTECPIYNKVYIGQTGRCLKHQLQEHHHALRKSNVAACAIAEHTLATGHGVDLSNLEVVDCHPHTAMRCLMESWYIQQSTDNLNRE